MTGGLIEVPRRGTPNRRRWTIRALAIGVLPAVAGLAGAVTLWLFALTDPGEAPVFSDIAVLAVIVLVFAAVLGFVATLDARTRTAGVATLVIAALLNPASFALVQAAAGVRW